MTSYRTNPHKKLPDPPMHRYDKSSPTPLRYSACRPRSQFRNNIPASGGFLAAEQFNQAYRDDDVSNLSSLPDPPVNISHTYELYDSESKHDRVCDADATTEDARVFIQSTFQSIFSEPTMEELRPEKRSSMHQHATKESSHSRSKSRSRLRRRQESSAAYGGEKWRRVGQDHAEGCMAVTIDLGRRLGECMLVSADVYKHQYETAKFRAKRACGESSSEEETKEQASQWPEHIRMRGADDNSVVTGRGGDDNASSPSFPWLVNAPPPPKQTRGKTDDGCGLPGTIDVMGNACNTKLEQCNTYADSKVAEEEGENGNLRDLRLRLFQCDNDNNVVVPHCRLARALAELTSQDELIEKLQFELLDAKKDLEALKKEEVSSQGKEDVGTEGTNSSNTMSLRTEIVTLRSQLADAKAELLQSKKVCANSDETTSQEVQRLQRLLDQSEEKANILEVEKDMAAETAEANRKKAEADYLAKLKEAENKIAELSDKSKDDERIVMEAKKPLQLELEQTKEGLKGARIEVSKARHELFNNRLKLAQAESRAENLEHLANKRQAELLNRQTGRTVGVVGLPGSQSGEFSSERERELLEQLSLAKMQVEKLKSTSETSSKESRQEEENLPSRQTLESDLNKANEELNQLRWELSHQKLLVAKAQADKDGAEKIVSCTRESESLLKQEKEQLQSELFFVKQDCEQTQEALTKSEQEVNHLQSTAHEAEKRQTLSDKMAGLLEEERDTALSDLECLRSKLCLQQELSQHVVDYYIRQLTADTNIKLTTKESLQEEEVLPELESALESNLAKVDVQLDRTCTNNSKQQRLVVLSQTHQDGAETSSKSSTTLAEELEQLKREMLQVKQERDQIQEALTRAEVEVNRLQHPRDVRKKQSLSEKMAGLLENKRDSVSFEREQLPSNVCLQRELSEEVIDYNIRQQLRCRDKLASTTEKLQAMANLIKKTEHKTMLMELSTVTSLRYLREHLDGTPDTGKEEAIGGEIPDVQTASQNTQRSDSLLVQGPKPRFHCLSRELERLQNATNKRQERKKDSVGGSGLDKQHLMSKATQTVTKMENGKDDDATQGCQNKAALLKSALRRREVDFILRFHKNSSERVELAHELAQSREYNQILQGKISVLDEKLSKAEAELEELRGKLTPIGSKSAEDDISTEITSSEAMVMMQCGNNDKENGDTTLENGTVKSEPKIDVAVLRSELEEILSLLAETKRKWQADNERAEAEIEQRKKSEEKLLSEIQSLRSQIESRDGAVVEGTPGIPKTERSDSSVAQLLARASFVTRRKDAKGELNLKAPSSPVQLGPDDEPPLASLAFRTPVRNNRSSPNSRRENEEYQSETGGTSSDIIDTTASVSTITFAQTRNDFTSFLPSDTGLDVVRAGMQLPSLCNVAASSEVSVPQRTGSPSSNASDSSILSPPVLSMTLPRRPGDLREPVPVYASNGVRATNRPIKLSESPSALELVTQLKSLFERGSPET